jgi:Xaa-Pro aminopeptidase
MKKNRIRKAVRILKEEKVDALLITDMVTIRYLSGFTGSEASVIITPEAFFVLVDSRYTTQARREAPLFHISRVSKRTEDTAKLIARLKIKKAGFDAKSITFADHKELEEGLTKTSLVPVHEALSKLRMRKEKGEADIIREGTGIAANGFNQIKDQIRAGTAERDVALALEFALRKGGAEKMSFDTIVASGKRSALPHGLASNKKIRTGEFVTIDFGIQYQGYCTDETCTVITSAPTQKQKKVYTTVKEAHDRAIDRIKAGVSSREVDRAAREHIEKKGFGSYFGHGTGHGVGLSVHEEPRLSPLTNEPLEEGMIVTVEPGIYIPNWGGVRIEDMVLVTRDGREVLTALPKRLEVLS